MVISVKNADFSLKKMSLWQVVIIGVAYMTPMVVFDTFGIVSGITDGRVPLAYILALVAMLLTAFSYARFSRISGDSGSAYNYTAQSCGAKAGFFVGWCSLLDYILLPLVNALLASIYLEAVIPSVPYWVWVVLFTGLVTLINCFRVNILANLSLVFVLLPLLLMVLFFYFWVLMRSRPCPMKPKIRKRIFPVPCCLPRCSEVEFLLVPHGLSSCIFQAMCVLTTLTKPYLKLFSMWGEHFSKPYFYVPKS